MNRMPLHGPGPLTWLLPPLLLALALPGCRQAPVEAPAARIALDGVGEAVVEQVQKTVAQEFHDMGARQLELEKERLQRQDRRGAALVVAALGLFLIGLALPNFVQARWNAALFALGLALLGAVAARLFL